MKHLRIIGLACLALALLACQGCRTFKEKQAKQLAKVEGLQEKIDDKRVVIVKQASAQVYATGLALDYAPLTNPAVSIARQFNHRAQTSLGPPAYEDSIDYEAIVIGLLKTNAVANAKAVRSLADKDAVVVSLQDDLATLTAKLDTAETARDKGYRIAAVSADKWARLIRILWWIGGIGLSLILIPIFLKIAALFFPVLAPVAAVVDSMAGAVVRATLRLAPKAAEKAQVVSQVAYDKSNAALEDLVISIQRAKTQNGAVDAGLTPVLKEVTDVSTRATINEVKADLQLK